MEEDSFLRALAEAITDCPLVEKVLVQDSLTAGRVLLERLALTGRPWVNLRCETPMTLALEIAADDLAVSGLQHADEMMTFLLCAEISSGVPEAASYLAEVGLGPGVLRAVYHSLTELRLNGNAAEHLPPGAFIDQDKGQALRALLDAFERELAARHWADDADVLRRAAGVLREHGGGRAIHLIPRICKERATGLQREFLAALAEGNLHVLELDKPSGLAALISPGPEVRPEAPVKIDLFASDGINAEVREAVKRVIRDEVPLEEVSLLIPREEGYLRAIGDLAARLDLPYTSASGAPVAWTRPGRAALALLSWLADDCPVRILAQALSAGDLLVPAGEGEEKPGGSTCARLLRTAGIGWGRERYLPALDAQRGLYEQTTGESGAEGTDAMDEDWRRGKLRTLDLLSAWLQVLFGLIPVPDGDGNIHLAELCLAIGEAVERFAAAASAEDNAAKTAIIDRMRAAGAYAAGVYPLRDAVEYARTMVAGIRVGSSGPRPGYLHVAPQSAGWFAGRRRVFLVGLDEASYPPSPPADPLLLDEERAGLGPRLPTGTESAERSLAALSWTLDCLEGHLTCSYSTRQPGEERRSFPSALMLQAYRHQAGDPGAGYNDLARALASAPARPDEIAFSRDEWWLARIAAGPVWAQGRDLIERACPSLGRGRELLAARASTDFTPYDGNVGAKSPELDPRLAPDLALSPSRLERLGGCPLKYFFLYVLGIRPPMEIERDPGAWLDAANRGTLLHTIFRRFYERLGTAVGGAPGERELLLDVCRESLEDFKREVPPPSEAVCQREQAEIIASAEVFLDMERRGDRAALPVYFEVPFGQGMDELSERAFGLADPVIITLPGGAIRLRGRIDRIDRTGEHAYRVWDYKTGRGYDEGGAVDGGRRLQHALYIMAAEEILRGPGGDPQAKVEASGYRFPTLRGEARPIWLPEGNARALALQAVDKLCDVAAGGAFIAGAKETACQYCDYFAACGPDAVRQAAAKAAAGHPELHPFLEVRSLA